MPEKLSDDDTAKTIEAFKILSNSLGPNDIYKQIILEEIFAYMMDITNDEFEEI